MDSEINYSKLTLDELKILITVDDMNALEEFTKRVDSGAVQPKHYTTNEAREIVAKNIKARINSETDYTKLTVRELKHLMGATDRKADDEYHRRVLSGEIKLRRINLEQMKEMAEESIQKTS